MLKSHKQTILQTLGRHPIHPFPARMAPGIALDALGSGTAPMRVLDPMAGSGTVLAVARAKGHRAIGIDTDPLAVLLTRVWTRSIEADRVNAKATEVLQRAKKRFSELTVARAYPSSDPETRRFVRYWFDGYARRQLASLAMSIRLVRNRATRDALWCGFSRLIITKTSGASLAMDLSHSRPHKKYRSAPRNPFNHFVAAVRTVTQNCPQRGGKSLGPRTSVVRGDARELDVTDESIDLVLTSPPYLNAIDYMRCSKFSLVWMGLTVSKIRQIRKGSVGSEAASERASESDWVQAIADDLELRPKLSARHAALLARYVWDMGHAVEETARVLKPGGRAVYVVGDSTVRGTFVRNSSVVVAVAKKHGLVVRSRQSRELPASRRYMPPPKKNASSVSIGEPNAT